MDYKVRIKPGSPAWFYYNECSIQDIVNKALNSDGVSFSEKHEIRKALMARIQDLEETQGMEEETIREFTRKIYSHQPYCTVHTLEDYKCVIREIQRYYPNKNKVPDTIKNALFDSAKWIPGAYDLPFWDNSKGGKRNE